MFRRLQIIHIYFAMVDVDESKLLKGHVFSFVIIFDSPSFGLNKPHVDKILKRFNYTLIV